MHEPAPTPTLGRPARSILAWAVRRKWPVVATLGHVTAGMVFSFVWMPLTQAGMWAHYWLVPGDIWGVYRSAHFIGWGDYGGIYTASFGFFSFPGILVLYAPLAMLTGALGMSEDFPYVLAHPTSWLLLGPYELLIGSVVLFALDSLAQRLDVPKTRRAVLCFVEAAILWVVDARMGHPEDALALAFAVYTLLALWNGRSKRAGWLFGLAVLFQPLVLLMLPLLFFQTRPRERVQVVVRGAVPSMLALVVPLTSNWSATTQSLVEQPCLVRLIHVTPWTSWAPKVGPDAIATGSGRMIALVLATLVGWWTMRRRLTPADMVWVAAWCLSLHTLTDPALSSYYPWPPLAMALVAAATGGRSRTAAVSLCAIGVTVLSSWHYGPWWLWWCAVVGGLLLTVAVARPSRGLTRRHEVVSGLPRPEHVTVGRERITVPSV